MKVCIFGAGAVGGYFGGRLAQAGTDVTFIARGAHLDVINANGLHVKNIHGDFIVNPAAVTDQPETVGVVDVVLCCVKSWQVADAFIDQLPAEGTASMQRDIMARRPSELHEQCGVVVRYGERNGVPTPVTRFIYHSRLPLEHAARAPGAQS